MVGISVDYLCLRRKVIVKFLFVYVLEGEVCGGVWFFLFVKDYCGLCWMGFILICFLCLKWWS